MSTATQPTRAIAKHDQFYGVVAWGVSVLGIVLFAATYLWDVSDAHRGMAVASIVLDLAAMFTVGAALWTKPQSWAMDSVEFKSLPRVPYAHYAFTSGDGVEIDLINLHERRSSAGVVVWRSLRPTFLFPGIFLMVAAVVLAIAATGGFSG